MARHAAVLRYHGTVFRGLGLDVLFAFWLALLAATTAEQGIALYRAGRFAEAEATLARAADREPGNIRAEIWLARAQAAQRKNGECLVTLRRLLEEHPDDPEAQFEAGQLLEDLAGSAFERVKQVAPDSVEAHILLGKSYEARGRLPEALAEYRVALKKDPRVPGLHFLTGNILWKNREFEAALPELEAELRLNPNHSMANYRAGNIYLSRGEEARAIPYLEAAVHGEPALLGARRDLGKAFRVTGKLPEALEQLRYVAAKDPENDFVHAQLAAVYRAMGDAEHAAAEMRAQREILRKRFEAGQKK
jgi:tetratricopeptide (TPR) repeat protein